MQYASTVKEFPGDTFGAWAGSIEDTEPQSIPNTEDPQPRSTDNAEDAAPKTYDKENYISHEGKLFGFVLPRTVVQYIDALNIKSTP